MGTISPIRRWFLPLVALVALASPAFGQDTGGAGYDEESAGPLKYSDTEAAGAPTEPGTEPAAATPAAEEKPAASAEASVAGELDTDVPMEDEAKTPSEWTAKRKTLKPWKWGAPRHHSDLRGSTGFLHVTEAGSGDAGTFGVGLHAAYFHYTDYLLPGDENDFMWGSVNTRITPLKFLEIYAGIQSRANYNTKSHPQLFQALGDIEVGLKGYYTPVDWVTVGGLVGVVFMNPVGKVAASFDGTSVPILLLSTFDFAALNENALLRLGLEVGYVFDNSAKLLGGIEEDRGGCDQDVDGDGVAEYSGCLGPIERTALGINRNDQIRIGLALDSPLPYVSPMVEYMLEIPVNRQDFTCPKDLPGSADSCMDVEGFTGMRQWVTIGARVLPPLDSLAIDIGVDLGLTGYAPTVHELAAQAPWRIVFGLTYSFDPFPELPPPPPPPPAPEPIPPPPPRPLIAGYVHDATAATTPVPGAVVTYLGQDFNAQVADASGNFRSYPLPSGSLTLAVKAEGYEDATFTVEVPEPGALPPVDDSPESIYDGGTGPQPTAEPAAPAAEPALAAEPGATGSAGYRDPDQPLEIKLDCPLQPLPKKTRLGIKVSSSEGAPLSDVALNINGPVTMNAFTDAAGKFGLEVEAGNYTIAADKEGFFQKTREISATAGQDVVVDLQLSAKPKKSQIAVTKKRITIKKKIHFETDSDVIKSESFGIMDEIADALLRHPEIKRLEIQGHTDNKGKRDYNVDLSDRRAQSVRRYLVDAGVEASRVESKGYGPDKPIAPNVTEQGRSRNRRVEFVILERE